MTANSKLLPAAAVHSEIQRALRLCQDVLREHYADFGETLPDAPQDPQGWFDLLQGLPHRRRSIAALGRMKAAAEVALDRAHMPSSAVERFALLQCFLVALPRLPSLPVHDSIKLIFCATCAQIANSDKRWEGYYDHTGEPFFEIAKIATLRRFPVGQLSFDITRFPRSWLLKIHPLALPDVLMEFWKRLRAFGPLAAPHLCYWRPNPLFVLKTENQRSLWRIAKTLEMSPGVKGLMAESWFYSADVGEQFPHLAWLRNFYIDQGAYLVDMEPAEVKSGFLVGSAKRRRLYEERKFRPRRTLVLWRREDMLAWAAAHPELGDEADGSEPARNDMPARGSPLGPAPPEEKRPRLAPNFGWSSGKTTLVDCVRFINRHPKIYILSVLVLPALGMAAVVAALASRWPSVPAFLVTVVVMWVLQYFFLQ